MTPEVTRRYLTLTERAFPGSPSAALKVGDLVFVGDSFAPSAAEIKAVAGNARAQARGAFDALRELLAMAGGELDDVVDVVSFHADSRTIETALDVGRDYFESDPPAWTPVAVGAQRIPGQTIALSAVAHLGKEPKRCIVPETIKWWREYPISAGCRKGELLFVAGQYGSDADGNVNTPGDHSGQARNALNRVAEICRLGGGGLGDVIDVLSFHHDPRPISAVSSVYESEFFDDAAGPAFPAWTAVGATGLLKLGMLGQYRALADLGPGARLARTPDGFGWQGMHLSGAATKQGRSLLAATGAPPLDETGAVAHRGDPDAQARAAFGLLDESLAGLGASLGDVVQLVSFHLDPAALEAARRVADELLDRRPPPVWTAVGMTGAREEGQLHSIHALAVR